MGTRPKLLVQKWLNTASEKRSLIDAAVGNTPSLADVVKMVHPKPADKAREAFFAWLIGKPYAADALPSDSSQHLRNIKSKKTYDVYSISTVSRCSLRLNLTQKEAWAQIARQVWVAHGADELEYLCSSCSVYVMDGMADEIAGKLQDAQAIRKARVFPYQLLMAYKAASRDIPFVVREALHDALEVAVENVPDDIQDRL